MARKRYQFGIQVRRVKNCLHKLLHMGGGGREDITDVHTSCLLSISNFNRFIDFLTTLLRWKYFSWNFGNCSGKYQEKLEEVHVKEVLLH